MADQNKSEICDIEKKCGHTYVQWLVSILVATTLFNYGLQNGWISPMTKVLLSEESPAGRPLTYNELSWIASTMSITAVFGVFPYTYIADKFGRKAAIIAMLIPQTLCWGIKLVSMNPIALVIARVFAGLPAGPCFNIVPLYIKEISQDNIRGTMVAMSMMFQNIGLLVMYAMGGYMDYYVILWIVLCLPIITMLLMIVAPESPAFLVKKGKIEEATKTVAFLRGLDVDDKSIEKEIAIMNHEEQHYKTAETLTFIKIFQNKAWRRGFILCMLILTALDCNGHFTIQTYAWSIMTNSGVTVNPELQTLSVPLLMIVGSLVSMSCVDKLGRKPLLAGAFVVATLAFATLATTLLAQKYGVEVPSWIPVTAIVTSVWAYAAGVVPMAYVILSEVFNFQVRAKLMGCVVTYGWFVAFVQLSIYGPITEYFGMYTTFYVFAVVNIFGALVAFIMLPETKGRSVNEIERLLLGEKINASS